jgi:hypothetical protein
VKNGKEQKSRQKVEFDVPERIIACLAGACGGNLPDPCVVDATTLESYIDGHPDYAMKNIADWRLP